MDRRRNLMADVVSGGGMGMTDLPLLYEHTLTERTTQFDTGQNAFRCDKRIVIEVIIPRDTQGTGTTGCLMVGAHQVGNTITHAYQNGFFNSGNEVGLESQYGSVLIVRAVKMEKSQWISELFHGNLVNSSYKHGVTFSGLHPLAKEAITGLVIGNNKAGGDKTLAVGTTIKVWGY